MLGMLPVLGVHAFESAPAVTAQANPVLSCKGKGVLASGYESSQGFVVKTGSQAVADSVPSMRQHVRGMFDLRQELVANGVLVLADGLYRFTQDYSFSSPSTAAEVVLGRSANGRIEWKDAQGRTLKALQEAQAAVSVLTVLLASTIQALRPPHQGSRACRSTRRSRTAAPSKPG